MKSIKVAALAIVVGALSLGQTVEAREFAEIYTDCGLGALIAPRSDAVAAVTNVTWDLGTTAISSNISSPDSCAGGKAEAAGFVFHAYPSLERDLAQGEGEYLDALLVMTGCDKTGLSTALRADFTDIVSAEGYSTQTRYEQAETLYNTMQRRIERDFALTCDIAS